MALIVFFVLYLYQCMLKTLAWNDIPVWNARSGLHPWVDPETPVENFNYTSSRGQKWQLVMSDEFNHQDRTFIPGKDHLWTSLDKPDGVNAALEIYSHDMVSVECESEIGSMEKSCFLQIKVIDQVNTIKVFNSYKNPPGFQNSTFFYRSAMIQSWNKFCFQGGMVEVRAQLPAAMGEQSQNPDRNKQPSKRVGLKEFYPTWPGIWMMGNLGRALFTASTNRIWPFSYSECEKDIFDPRNQRISACDGNPGSGLNPHQGRGAPEIDIFEGGGVAMSASIQIGPGMRDEFRTFPINYWVDNPHCVYEGTCSTLGANYPDVPTAYYQSQRKHRTWYQGLRYASNDLCEPDELMAQNYATIKRSLQRGIESNFCSKTTCPDSFDVNGDLSYMDGSNQNPRWGINRLGTCFAKLNGYSGTYLCDPDNQDSHCPFPRANTTAPSRLMESFAYQMDAISANYDLHVGAYLGFEIYQVEWYVSSSFFYGVSIANNLRRVPGDQGYVRWMIGGFPVFEIPASSITIVPQNEKGKNPKRIFPDEPMYIVVNIAMSANWGATPPNPGFPCRGDGSNERINRICDSFPMYLKVDYIRVYQDTSFSSRMSVGCDPKSHPTKDWIKDHLEEYEDEANKVVPVAGGGICRVHDDCNPLLEMVPFFRTGQCNLGRCECTDHHWGGPRCTVPLTEFSSTGGQVFRSYGPPFALAVMSAVVVIFGSSLFFFTSYRRRILEERLLLVKTEKVKRRVIEHSLGFTYKRNGNTCSVYPPSSSYNTKETNTRNLSSPSIHLLDDDNDDDSDSYELYGNCRVFLA